MMRTVHVGEQFPDLAHNGHVLPIESTVATSTYTRDLFTHTAPRVWVMGSATALIDPYYMNTAMVLRQLPDVDEVELPRLTASQWKWHLRDSAIAAADRSGVALAPVLEMAAQFGAPNPLFTVGGVVSNSFDLKQLPTGAIYYSGHPSRPDLLNVWERTEEGAKHLLGPAPHRGKGHAVVLYSLPDLPDPVVEEPADDVTLATIALRAWRVGKVYKRKHSWCSVFENTLAALGINEQNITASGETTRGPGDELDREQTALLPEGSLLYWSWNNRRAMAVYRRDNTARNRSRTRRVWGFNDDRAENSHDRMVVFQTPDEPIAWTVSGSYLLRMPDGTQFRDGNGYLVTLSDGIRASVDSWRIYAIEEWVA